MNALYPKLLFLSDAAKLMRRNVKDFKRIYIHSGLIPIIEEGDRVMIDPKDLERYIIINKKIYVGDAECPPSRS